MPQIIQETTAGGRLGEMLGTGLGSGLSSGLQQLASMKMQQLAQRQQQAQLSQGLQGLGFSPEQSAQLSQFGPDIVQRVVQEKMRGTQRAVATGPGLQALIPELSQQEASVIGALPPSLQAQYYRNYLQTLGTQGFAPQQQAGLEALSALAPQVPQAQQVSQMMATQQPQQVVQPQVIEAPAAPQPKVAAQLQKAVEPVIPEVQKAPIERPKTVAERAAEKRAQQAIAKEEKIEQFRLEKEVQPVLNELNKNKAIAEKGITRAEKWGDIILSGKLPGGWKRTLAGIAKAVPYVGGDILRDPESVQFKSLITEALREEVLPKFKGLGALSDKDMEIAAKSFPDLLNTDEGNLRILDQLMSGYKADIAKADAADRVLARYEGKAPKNFRKLVEEEAKPDLLKLANQFKYGQPQLYGTQISK